MGYFCYRVFYLVLCCSKPYDQKQLEKGRVFVAYLLESIIKENWKTPQNNRAYWFDFCLLLDLLSYFLPGSAGQKWHYPKKWGFPQELIMKISEWHGHNQSDRYKWFSLLSGYSVLCEVDKSSQNLKEKSQVNVYCHYIEVEND